MQCPNCHAEVRDGASFCDTCGAPLAAASSTPQAVVPRAPQPRKSRAWIAVVVLAAAFALVACCGVGALLALRAYRGTDVIYDPPLEEETLDAADEGEALTVVAGFEDPEDALIARLTEDGTPEYVYEIATGTDTRVVYRAGPPMSEYMEEIVVERTDGLWSVTEVTVLPSTDY